MTPFCPPVGDFPHWSHKKVLFWPFNKSLVDQACSVRMAGYWPSSFFLRFSDHDFASVYKNAKKELYQCAAIFT